MESGWNEYRGLVERLRSDFPAGEKLSKALSVVHTHFWLHQNAALIVEQLFAREVLAKKLEATELSFSEDVLAAEEFGAVENRVSYAIEAILDQIIGDVDQKIKELHEADDCDEKFDLLYPVIEVGSNIFPDLNLFMLFPDQNYPQSAQALLEAIVASILRGIDDGSLPESIRQYFAESWEPFSTNFRELLKRAGGEHLGEA